MKHSSYEASCSICKENAGDITGPGGVIWEDKLWFVQHAPPPFALAGWTMLNTQRHVQGPAHFTDEEANAYGPILRHITRTLEEVTNSPRVYVIAFGEISQHMHSHLAPRYVDLPSNQISWGVADLYRGVANGTQPGVPESDALAVADKLRAALKASPPPS